MKCFRRIILPLIISLSSLASGLALLLYAYYAVDHGGSVPMFLSEMVVIGFLWGGPAYFFFVIGIMNLFEWPDDKESLA